MASHLMDAQLETPEAETLPSREVLAPHWSALGLSTVVSSLPGCGGGGGGIDAITPVVPPVTPPVPQPVGYRYTTAGTDEEAARFLMQAQFSASDSDVAAVRSMGFSAWLQQQIALLVH